MPHLRRRRPLASIRRSRAVANDAVQPGNAGHGCGHYDEIVATRSGINGIGIAVQESHIRVVEVEVGASFSTVKRFVSLPWRKAGLVHSIQRALDALDSQQLLPVGIACGSLSDGDQLNLLSTIGSSRTVEIQRLEAAIAHLNLAPDTQTDSIDQLAGWSISARLFETYPDLEFSDLLGAIGAGLAMVDQPSGPANGAKRSRPPADVTLLEPKPKRPSDHTVRVPTAAAKPKPKAIESSGTTQSGDEPTRIRFPRSKPAQSPSAAQAQPGVAESGDQPTRIRLAKPEPAQSPSVAKAEPVVSESGFAPEHIALAVSDTELRPRQQRQRSFDRPQVTMAIGELSEQRMARGARHRQLTSRRPMPIALVLLIVLIGIGVAIGVVLSDGGSDFDRAISELLLQPPAA